MKETVFNMQKKNAGEVDLSEKIFAAPVNKALIYEVVKMQRANKRQGDAATKTRGFVSGTTAKMYRQKGTGRARHGDAKANIFVGGGKSFGPHPRDYGYKIPKKARRNGLYSALSLKRSEGKLLIVDDLKFEKPRTKEGLKVLCGLGVTKALIVFDGVNENLEKSVRNIPGVRTIRWEGLGVYDVLRHDFAVITLPALTKMQQTFLAK